MYCINRSQILNYLSLGDKVALWLKHLLSTPKTRVGIPTWCNLQKWFMNIIAINAAEHIFSQLLTLFKFPWTCLGDIYQDKCSSSLAYIFWGSWPGLFEWMQGLSPQKLDLNICVGNITKSEKKNVYLIHIFLKSLKFIPQLQVKLHQIQII